ncbi:serine protease [Mycoplasmatota bacterium zrk1]
MISKEHIKTVTAIKSYVNGKSGDCIGTGFFVGAPHFEDGKKTGKYHTFLVTNKHVVLGKKFISLDFNRLDSSVVNYSIDMENNENVKFHPNHDIDIVLVSLDGKFLTEKQLDIKSIPIEEQALLLEDIKNHNIIEGYSLLSIGFPMNLVDEEHMYPIVRVGCIARISDLFLEQKKVKTFLADLFTYPGNSGSPVFLDSRIYNPVKKKVENKVALIGILNSYITYREVLYSRQTQRDRMIMEENSGLTNVFVVDYIIEAIKLFKFVTTVWS